MKVVLRHGDFVSPEWSTMPGATFERLERTTNKERPAGKFKVVIKRFAKPESAAKHPIAFGWIRATYADAIEYTSITKEGRGQLFMIGFLAFLLFFGTIFLINPFPIIVESINKEDYEWALENAALSLMFGAIGTFFLVMTSRAELFRPVDEPIIFDRRTRKVYRILQVPEPGWFVGLFKPWPLYCVAYHWDLIDAEHNAAVAATGTVVQQHNALTFLVRKSVKDPTIIDAFNVGQISALTAQSVPALWEHIRRFMEEDGPHLPPGEDVYAPKPPNTFLQSLRAALPTGPQTIKESFNESPGLSMVFVILFPLFGPMFFFAGIGNWLSFKTARRIEWPASIRQVLGPTTRGTSSGAARTGRN